LEAQPQDQNPEINLDKILSRVRGLIAKAEHESTPPHEAALAAQMADALMLKYSINAAQADAARPRQEQSKPVIISVEVGGYSDILGYIGSLCETVAEHCRCKVRTYADWHDGSWFAKVYGFESDVRYFELLYTTLRLHMVGALIPRFETHKSLEENCYNLHMAGYNWLEIAAIDGWNKVASWERQPQQEMKIPYRHKDGRIQPATQVGSHYKRAYQRAARDRNESHRKSSASGYVSQLARRLREVASGRAGGSELILRTRIDDLDALFRKDNPDMFRKLTDEELKAESKNRPKYRYKPVNPAAFERGVHVANTADLNNTSRVGNQGSRAVGEG
jgi:hypothetical protein